MKALSQILAVTALNLRTLVLRRGNSLVIVLGTMGVVAVLISVLAMTTGFRRTIEAGGRPDRAVVQTLGAPDEDMSALSREDVQMIESAAGILRGADGKPYMSAELLGIVPVIRKSDGSDAFVTMRGVGPLVLAVRPELHLLAGRLPRPGLREAIVGTAAQKQFVGLDVGDEARLADGDWTVVGAFESGGSAHESTVIVDAQAMLSAYRRNVFNTVTVRLASADSFSVFKDALTAMPNVKVEALREPEFLAAASQPFNRMLNLVAYAIGGIMAIGALFGALNTMYSAVSVRSAEIATLRALGFNATAVVVSVFVEALILALAGAALGVLIVYAAFSGQVVSTTGNTVGNHPQIIYTLSITTELVLTGVALACLLGFLGGLFPAVRAARLPVAEALRAK